MHKGDEEREDEAMKLVRLKQLPLDEVEAKKQLDETV